MSDATLPPPPLTPPASAPPGESRGPDSDLLLGVMALQLNFISQPDLKRALGDWVADRARSLGQVLVDQSALTPHRHELLGQLVHEFLQQYDRDPAVGLTALCEARSYLDLTWMTTPVLRSNLATLPS